MKEPSSVKKLREAFERESNNNLLSLTSAAEKLNDLCHEFERSWSGSYAGWHGTMYFKDFKMPAANNRFNGEWGGLNGIPENWESTSPEIVRAAIEQRLGDGFKLKALEASIDEMRKNAESLKNEVLIVFSAYNFSNQLEKEGELYQEIEGFSFGKTRGDYVGERLPRNLMTRDAEALRQGIYLPTWLYYECVALEGLNLKEHIQRFLQLSDRLERQLEIKNNATASDEKPRTLNDLHPDISKKCLDLYNNKTYAEAVEKSFKVVRDRLRLLSDYETGSDAFGKGHLYINGASAPNVEQDFNNAVKFLTMAIDQFRNEKSHTSDANVSDPIRAFEYLSLSSLAMHLLDDAVIKSK